MLTLPKLTLAGLTEICDCTPVPLSEIVAGELVALLTTLRLPVAFPALAGAKLAVSVRLWPVARVVAPEKPLTVNPAPLRATCETRTLPVPVFVSTIVCEAELPTGVLPKLKLLALVESRYVEEPGGGVDDVAIPVPETEIREMPPVLRYVLSVMLPLKLLAAFGSNTTWKDVLL